MVAVCRQWIGTQALPRHSSRPLLRQTAMPSHQSNDDYHFPKTKRQLNITGQSDSYSVPLMIMLLWPFCPILLLPGQIPHIWSSTRQDSPPSQYSRQKRILLLKAKRSSLSPCRCLLTAKKHVVAADRFLCGTAKKRFSCVIANAALTDGTRQNTDRTFGFLDHQDEKGFGVLLKKDLLGNILHAGLHRTFVIDSSH